MDNGGVRAQKQSPTSEMYKQYTPYSAAALRGGKYWQSRLVVYFMHI